MSVLLLTFTVSSNGYHKAYARGDLDALGTKIRESINNQITEELSGSAVQNPSSSSGFSPTSSSLSPSSGSPGLTTSSPIPATTQLTLSIRRPISNLQLEFHGHLEKSTGAGIGAATITFTGTDVAGNIRPIMLTGDVPLSITTNPIGDYIVLVFKDQLSDFVSVTAHYAGFAPSDSHPEDLPNILQ